MKATILILTVALSASTCLLTAQEGNPPPRGERPPPREGGPDGPRGPHGPGGPGGPGGPRMVSPLVAALDLNHDGVIDADEMAKAGESLKKLDRNHDGKLTMEEYRPQRPGGPGGPDGERRPGGEHRPGRDGQGEGRPGDEGRLPRPEQEK